MEKIRVLKSGGGGINKDFWPEYLPLALDENQCKLTWNYVSSVKDLSDQEQGGHLAPETPKIPEIPWIWHFAPEKDPWKFVVTAYPWKVMNSPPKSPKIPYFLLNAELLF